jgi:hypothetical protein
MFTSDSYICFASKEDGCCNVVLPLREVDSASYLCCPTLCFLKQPFIIGMYLSPFSVALAKYLRQGKLKKKRDLLSSAVLRLRSMVLSFCSSLVKASW